MIYFLFLSRYMSSVLMYLQIVRIYSSLLISASAFASGSVCSRPRFSSDTRPNRLSTSCKLYHKCEKVSEVSEIILQGHKSNKEGQK
jgi:hypothetical protein